MVPTSAPSAVSWGCWIRRLPLPKFADIHFRATSLLFVESSVLIVFLVGRKGFPYVEVESLHLWLEMPLVHGYIRASWQS
jgi:hypothetical protein